MLDGFVVPHAHFRVFHGDARGQMALLFGARGAAPTDLHVREFAQLEAQLKALQPPPPPAAHPTSSLVGAAQAAALAEYLALYARLFTPESFTSPDFLAIVFAKLTEHFVASETDLVRKTVLELFRGARAHVAQVGDGSKIVTLLRGLLGQSTTKLWALRLVETMPTLVKDDASIRTSLLSSLKSTDAQEQRAAIDAVRALLPFSRTLRKSVFAEVAVANSAVIVELTPLTIDDEEESAALQAWNLCASVFHDQVNDEDALVCLRAAANVAAKFECRIIPQHLKLVRYVISNDPRPVVMANVWSTCEGFLCALKEGPVIAELFSILTLQLQHLDGSNRVAHSGALRALSLVSELHGTPPPELVALVRTSSSRSRHHRRQCIQLLAQWTRWELTKRSSERGNQHDSEGYLAPLTELIQFLSPVHYASSPTLWHSVGVYLESLASDFDDLIADTIGRCYVELIRIARRKQLLDMEARVWSSLSHISVNCPTVVADALELIGYDAVAALNKKGRQAVVVCLITASGFRGGDMSLEAQQLCLQLTEESLGCRYDVARVAMSGGVSSFSTKLLKTIAEHIDHEGFGSWLRALISINEAEAMIQSEQVVSMDAIDLLVSGKSFLQAVDSGTTNFEFQIAYIQARLTWMELMLQAQQYAAEIAHTNNEGGVRERRLSEAFATNAAQWIDLRGKLLCSTPGDRDVLWSYAHLSALLAKAVVELLVLDSSKHDPVHIPVSATKISSSRYRFLSSLEVDVLSKAERLRSLDSARRPLVGSTIFAQLLQAVCTSPPSMPRQFFRTQARPHREIRCNMQFLTQAEATSYSSKPRTRSQLGVAVGTEFTSSLHGAFVVHQSSSLLKTAKSALIKIFLVCDKAEANGTNGSKEKVQETTISLPEIISSHVLSSSDYLYLPVITPVAVASDKLMGKGTYTIEATASLIDDNGEEWEVASTGSRRGIIVY